MDMYPHCAASYLFSKTPRAVTSAEPGWGEEGGVEDFDTGSLNPHKEQNKEGECTDFFMIFAKYIY